MTQRDDEEEEYNDGSFYPDALVNAADEYSPHEPGIRRSLGSISRDILRHFNNNIQKSSSSLETHLDNMSSANQISAATSEGCYSFHDSTPVSVMYPTAPTLLPAAVKKHEMPYMADDSKSAIYSNFLEEEKLLNVATEAMQANRVKCKPLKLRKPSFSMKKSKSEGILGSHEYMQQVPLRSKLPPSKRRPCSSLEISRQRE